VWTFQAAGTDDDAGVSAGGIAQFELYATRGWRRTLIGYATLRELIPQWKVSALGSVSYADGIYTLINDDNDQTVIKKQR